MKIKIITCSGPNEKVNTSEVLSLLSDYSIAEIGVQSSGIKCSYGTPRYNWIKKLVDEAQNYSDSLQAALHINLDWCEDFCNGVVAPELAEFLSFRHKNKPFFSRVQLNFTLLEGKNVVDMANPQNVANAIKAYPEHRFILSYNNRTADFIKKIYSLDVPFDVLYDASFGAGISPNSWEAPAFLDRLQGYAGGLGAENIKQQLDNIMMIVPAKTEIFIDAQGKLEDEKGAFSADKARMYIENALEWQRTI